MVFAALRAARQNRRILTVLVCLVALRCFGLEFWTGSRLGSEHELTALQLV